MASLLLNQFSNLLRALLLEIKRHDTMHVTSKLVVTVVKKDFTDPNPKIPLNQFVDIIIVEPKMPLESFKKSGVYASMKNILKPNAKIICNE